MLVCLKSSFSYFLLKNFGFEIKIAEHYIRVFDCSVREFYYLFGTLSPLGAGFAGTTILQPAVFEKRYYPL